MKIKNKTLSSFLIFFDLLLILVGILLKLFVDAELWRNLLAIIAVFSVLLALSDLYRKSANDRRNLSLLSSSVIDPLYNKYLGSGLFKTSDGNDITKMNYSGNSDFNQSLRSVTDSRERSMQELAWEYRCNKRRMRKSKSDAVFSAVFLILAFVVLIGAVVLKFFFPQYYPNFDRELLELVILCCFAFAIAVAYANGGNFSSLQTVQTVLGLRDRCLEADDQERTVRPEPTPPPQVVIPVQVAVPQPVVSTTPILPQQPHEPPASPDSTSSSDSGEKEWKPINEEET